MRVEYMLNSLGVVVTSRILVKRCLKARLWRTCTLAGGSKAAMMVCERACVNF